MCQQLASCFALLGAPGTHATVVSEHFSPLCFSLGLAAQSYHAFLASDAVIKQIPRLLGPGLNEAGKFPTPIAKTVQEQVRGALMLNGPCMHKITALGICMGDVAQLWRYCFSVLHRHVGVGMLGGICMGNVAQLEVLLQQPSCLCMQEPGCTGRVVVN